MNKKSIILFFMLIVISFSAFAQKPRVILGAGIGEAHFREPYHQNFNRTLSADTVYILTGWYFVDSTYQITIPAGTLIRGDSTSAGTLIIKRGARIFAQGNRHRPIVFTSNDPVGKRNPGDWGGVIILGKAPTNQPTTKQVEGGFGTIPNSDAMYGGSDPDDNSGVFRYVRIEFAGSVFSQDNESNGLTLGGVGRGTIINHIQVSFGNDDDYEFFGGTVDAKYLISWRTLDDTYDSDFGWSGRLQFVYTKRDPLIFDASAPGSSNGFESDNEGASPYNALPRTKARISNATIVGPQRDTSTSVNAKYQFVALLRRATELSIYNSILMGYPRGIQLRDTLTQRAAIDNRLEIRNTSLQSMAANLLTLSSSPSTGNIPGFNIKDWFDGVPPYTSTGNIGSTPRNVRDVGLPPEVFNLDNTNNPVPLTGSEAATAGTSYQGRLAGDLWFDPVSYRGAFDPSLPRGQQWDAGWTNYEPENYNPEDDTYLISVELQDGWNMVSNPFKNLPDNSLTTLFPQSISYAYSYDRGYRLNTSLEHTVGYWIKVNGNQTQNIVGIRQDPTDTFKVVERWNIIGSLSAPININDLIQDPPGIISSQFFTYNGSYVHSTQLIPGRAYWVKFSQNGKLYVNSLAVKQSNSFQEQNAILENSSMVEIFDSKGRSQTLYILSESDHEINLDYFELPPPPPNGFDVRFISTNGNVVKNSKDKHIISINTDAFPLTIKWRMKERMNLYAENNFVKVLDGSGTTIQLNGLSTLTISNSSISNSLPETFGLGKNFPNPFNPLTQFTIDIPRLSYIQLAVYNILGQKIKTLVSGEISPGSYKMEWNGTDDQGISVPSGIYFIRMSADDYRATQKIMLLK